MKSIIICPKKALPAHMKSTADLSSLAAVISSSYPIDESRFSEIRHLSLCFNDTDNPRGENPFTAVLAEKAAAFIIESADTCETFFMCCDSGESRSAAIAAATELWQQSSDMYIWENPHLHPNLLVFGIMCEALGVFVDNCEIDHRVKLNDNALKKAISDSRNGNI